MLAIYTPPTVGAGQNQTSYSYNADRQLIQINRPDGQIVKISYDAAGRLNTLTSPQGTVSYAYQAATGKLATIDAPGGSHLSYSYNGTLRTGVTWSGPVAGTVEYTYDNDFRLATLSVNGANPITFQYDPDGLLTRAGALTLRRDAQNGLLSGSTLGLITDTWSYNGFAEPVRYQATFSGADLLTVQYARDKLGRITAKTETIGGVTDTYGYSYDLAGRLTQVTKNSTPLATYTYDSNGNRLSYTGPGGTVTGNYDAQDRLLQYGATSYTYTANGELFSKTTAGQTTTYNYDALGNLIGVTQPGGTLIEYLVDGQNRRIGKKVNGVLVQGFLYQDQLEPVAELDGNGNSVSRFIYGASNHVPDYMIKGGVTYRIISDQLGSVHLVVNTQTGQVTQQMNYGEFGNVVQDTNPRFQSFGFVGGLYDQDTGLVRFGVRDYDAMTGRWMTKDANLFDRDEPNLYAYVENEPTNWIDMDGLAKKQNNPSSFLEGITDPDKAKEILDDMFPDDPARWKAKVQRWEKSVGRKGSSLLRKSKKFLKKADKVCKPLIILFFFYDFATQGPEKAVENAVMDSLWPFIDESEAY